MCVLVQIYKNGALSDYAEADNTRNTGPNHSNIASVLGMRVSTVAAAATAVRMRRLESRLVRTSSEQQSRRLETSCSSHRMSACSAHAHTGPSC